MINFFTILIAIFAFGALGSLIFHKNYHIANLFSNFSAIIGSLIGIIFSGSLLLTKNTASASIATSFPIFKISISIDFLSSLFVLVISTITLCASIYGLSYMKHYYTKYNLGLFGFFYNLFILSLILVVTADNGIYFLFCWELMSLASLFLVIFEHKKQEIMRAGNIYFIMTHAGTVFILLAFLILFHATGSFEFSVIKNSLASIPQFSKDIVFILALIGFGTKAGIIPLHIWLPKAHSAAPSQVSALMSGVMIKMGIFMMIRFFIDIFYPTPLWWGLIVLIIGAFSSILGVLYALSEHDIKRLLAYHSIENIGIILLGIGSSIIFSSLGQHSLANLALLAGLFHTVNHAIFKSLLFFGAGSVISQAHTRNIEEYGGLIKLMPYTAALFLIGSIAISGLPPFNGFVSEWLTFQALFAGINSQTIFLKGIFIFASACLAFTGGLAAACFVKAFGITFLARPRSIEAEKAKESPLSLRLGMLIVAALCLILGVFSNAFMPLLKTVAGSLGTLNNNKPIAVNTVLDQLNMPTVFGGLIIAIVATLGLTYWLSRKQKIVIGENWNCGFYSMNSRAEITSTGFARSLILIFKGIFQPTKQDTVEYVDANIRYFTKSTTIILATLDMYEKYIYYPINKTIFYLSIQAKKIQSGNLNLYLLYILISLIALIVWARF